MKKFGAFLAAVRKNKGLNQQQLAEQITERGCQTSQAKLAQYESGKVADPDKQTLRLFAEICEVDWLTMITALTRDKYGPSIPAAHQPRFLDYLACLERLEHVGVPLLEQMERAAEFCHSTLVLDVQGLCALLALQETNTLLWLSGVSVIESPLACAALRRHLIREVQVTIFLQDPDRMLAQIDRLRLQLTQGGADLEMNKRFLHQIKVIRVQHILAGLIPDQVIIDPHHPSAVAAFRGLHSDKAGTFFFRQFLKEAAQAVAGLSQLLFESQ